MKKSHSGTEVAEFLRVRQGEKKRQCICPKKNFLTQSYPPEKKEELSNVPDAEIIFRILSASPIRVASGIST